MNLSWSLLNSSVCYLTNRNKFYTEICLPGVVYFCYLVQSTTTETTTTTTTTKITINQINTTVFMPFFYFMKKGREKKETERERKKTESKMGNNQTIISTRLLYPIALIFAHINHCIRIACKQQHTIVCVCVCSPLLCFVYVFTCVDRS